MKTFPVKFYYRANGILQKIEDVRAEIKFSAETWVERESLPQVQQQVKNNLIEHLQRQIYGDIKDALLQAEKEICMMGSIECQQIWKIFDNLRNSIPKLTHD